MLDWAKIETPLERTKRLTIEAHARAQKFAELMGKFISEYDVHPKEE